MLGAASSLKANGFLVDAKESRSLNSGSEIAEELKEQGGLGDVVVIHLGANQDPLEQSDLDRMMAALADVPQVLFVTNRLNEGYIFEQNALIRTLPSQYSNVTVMDWAELGNGCPGTCFASDNLHLSAEGADFYADQVMSALGLE